MSLYLKGRVQCYAPLHLNTGIHKNMQSHIAGKALYYITFIDKLQTHHG